MISFKIYTNIIPSLYVCCLYTCLCFFSFFMCLFVVTKKFCCLFPWIVDILPLLTFQDITGLDLN